MSEWDKHTYLRFQEAVVSDDVMYLLLKEGKKYYI